MPDSQNRKNGAFAKYDAMSTEELQQILREDASKPEGEESDVDALFYIMEVLAQRRKGGKSPEEALKSFQENYRQKNKSLSDPESSPDKAKRHGINWKTRCTIAAAAMLVFIIGASVTSRAFGFDLWGAIAKWTQETLHFGYSGAADGDYTPSHNFTHPCASLQAAMDENNVTALLVPTWIPDGYKEVEIQTEETSSQRRVVATYRSGENEIRIRIVDYLSGAPVQVEQSDSLIEVYSSDNIDYYIFSSRDQTEAVWTNGKFECYISGPLTVTDLEKMIDSIGKG